MAKIADFRSHRRAAAAQSSLRVLAARCARALPGSFAPPGQRAQGRPGARCTRGLACKIVQRRRTRAYRFSGNTPAFPAQWLYGLSRAHPGVSGFHASVAPRNRHIGPVGPSAPPRDLTPTTEASGPHDFAVRFSAVRLPAVRSLTELIPPRHHLRARHCRVHRILSPRFVTIMIRPSERAGMGGNMRVIWGRSQDKFRKIRIFIARLISLKPHQEAS